MLTFLAENIANIIVIAIVAALFIGITIKLIQDIKNHKSLCGGNCESCGKSCNGCSTCSTPYNENPMNIKIKKAKQINKS